MLVLFLWLAFVELFLAYEKLPRTFGRREAVTTLGSLLPPLLYAIGLSMLNFKSGIIELGKIVGVPYTQQDTWYLAISWPFSVEYLFFEAFLLTSVSVIYGVKCLKHFMVTSFFLATVGFFYTLDTFYPHGTLTALQMFVPSTASTVKAILSFMGYKVQAYTDSGGTMLYMLGQEEDFVVALFWPCAGIYSIILYSLTIILFLRNLRSPLKRKLSYVAIGAVGTYLTNVLRIVTICVIGSTSGQAAATVFHEYYSELYFIAWMVLYLLAIYGVERLFEHRRQATLSQHKNGGERALPPSLAMADSSLPNYNVKERWNQAQDH